ncbi:MAG: hypothetical protein WCE38_11940 [Burkholderiales bacterium]
MKTQADRVPSPPLLVGGVLAILLGTAGFAAMTAWMPASVNEASNVVVSVELPKPPATLVGGQAPLVPATGEGDTRRTLKCAGCGVIAPMREIQQLAAGIDPGTAGTYM